MTDPKHTPEPWRVVTIYNPQDEPIAWEVQQGEQLLHETTVGRYTSESLARKIAADHSALANLKGGAS